MSISLLKKLYFSLFYYDVNSLLIKPACCDAGSRKFFQNKEKLRSNPDLGDNRYQYTLATVLLHLILDDLQFSQMK